MNVAPDLLRTHIEYTAWASLRLTEAAASLSEGELTRNFGTADRSILGTLAHIYAADRAWLRRVRGDSPLTFPDPGRDAHLEVLQKDWPRVMDEWKEWVNAQPEGAPTRIFSYQDLRGRTWESPLWKIVMHLVNHATHHRGQAIGFLRAMGHPPPEIGLINFYRAV